MGYKTTINDVATEHYSSGMESKGQLDTVYFMVGIENSAPARKPVGQRAVTVFMRV